MTVLERHSAMSVKEIMRELQLDSLRLSGSVGVVEPELLKKGVLNNALDALSGRRRLRLLALRQ